MTGLKSGAILVMLAAPFALYILWQVQSGARADFTSQAAPPDKGPPDGKRVADTKARAEKWTNDVRHASAVALQYRVPGPEDRADDPDCNAITKAVAARAIDLTDLEKFLSGVDRPVFVGSLKEQYDRWQLTKQTLAKAEAAIETWLRTPFPSAVDSQTAAVQVLKRFEDLVTEYRNASQFADSTRAAAWQVEARVKVLESLEAAAHRPFDEVLALPLPLPDQKTSKVVEKALGAPIAIREQVRLLEDSLSRDEAKRVISDRVMKSANSLIRRADEWAAKEQLLALFADPEIFTDPKKATDWIPLVHAQFNKTQTDSGRELIRKKVQQFCEAYIPKAARLDAKVRFRDKEEDRNNMKVVYQSGKQSIERPLTDHPATLNEFNFNTLHPDFDRITGPGGFGGKDSLKPTLASQVARDFTLARATVAIWGPTTTNQLKKKCEGDDAAVQQKRRELLDGRTGAGVESPSSVWTEQNSKIWTRLTALSEAMVKAPGLFDIGK